MITSPGEERASLSAFRTFVLFALVWFCVFSVPLRVWEGLRFVPVVPVLALLFVALWFILQGYLLYVLPCVILFLCFSVLLALRVPRLGKSELILVLFVPFVRFALVWFCLFPLPLGVCEGLWFVIVALPGRFSYPYFVSLE